MKFTSTKIADAWIIDLEPKIDERGSFARAWCQDEFAQHGISVEFVQSNIAVSNIAGTLRGLHFQAPPHAEAKLVRCTRGAAFVAIGDMRANSPSFRQWLGIELTAENRRLLFVPKGCAQGYQTLADGAEMFYQMSTAYVPGASRGIRYDDPFFNIQWPVEITTISQADQSWPPFSAIVGEGLQPIASSSH
jgi:dTDP-4-dehydrorhamnose 3,5-epimerase